MISPRFSLSVGALSFLALAPQVTMVQAQTCYPDVTAMQTAIDSDFATNNTLGVYNYVFCGGVVDFSSAAGPLEPKLAGTTIGCEAFATCVLTGAPSGGATAQVSIPSNSPIAGEVVLRDLRIESNSGINYAVEIGGGENLQVNIVSCVFLGETAGYVRSFAAGAVLFLNSVTDTMILQNTNVGTLFHHSGSKLFEVRNLKSNGPFSANNVVVQDGNGLVNLIDIQIEGGTFEDSMFKLEEGIMTLSDVHVNGASIGDDIFHSEDTSVDVGMTGTMVSVTNCKTSGAAGDSWDVFTVVNGGAMSMDEATVKDNSDIFRVANVNKGLFSLRDSGVMDNALTPGSVATDVETSSAILAATNSTTASFQGVEVDNNGARQAIVLAAYSSTVTLKFSNCVTNSGAEYVLFKTPDSSISFEDAADKFYTEAVTSGCLQIFTPSSDSTVDACIVGSDTCTGSCNVNDEYTAMFCTANGQMAPTASPNVFVAPTEAPTMETSSGMTIGNPGGVMVLLSAVLTLFWC